MSDSFNDGERTIIKPTPGGRRPVVRPPGMTPPPPAGSAASSAGMIPAAPMRFDLSALTQASFNVVVGAATPVINLARRLGGSPTQRDVETLRGGAVEEMKNFERRILAAGVPPEQARAAHYALCATLDDIVLNTPWGAYSSWAAHSMVSTFHTDVSGGERFFDLLAHLHKDPATNRDVLALMYVCLAIGFQGRMRVVQDGALELSRTRESLYRTLRQVYGDFERELSPHWQGVEARHEPVRSGVALWTIASATVATLLLAFFLLSWLVNRASDATLQALATAPPQGPVSTAVAQPMAVAQTAPSEIGRVSQALAPEIRTGLVSVSGDGQTMLIRIRNSGMFPSGSAEVDDRFDQSLQHIGQALSGGNGQIEVVGYTDSQPMHSLRYPSNWALSQARAQAVADILGQQIARGRMKVSGRGEAEPLASNETEQGRNANRRTELHVSVPTQGALDGSTGR